MDEKLEKQINRAVQNAFDAGRKYEHDLIWGAIDMCDQTTERGHSYVYLDDLKEHIEEMHQLADKKMRESSEQ